MKGTEFSPEVPSVVSFYMFISETRGLSWLNPWMELNDPLMCFQLGQVSPVAPLDSLPPPSHWLIAKCQSKTD